MANWTKDQKAAIDARNKNTIVAAAAGSGKTAVLVERIIGIVLDEKLGVDVDNLLVVTFTNAAAAEMKERISAAINDKLALNPESAHLQKQLSLLNRANIMTLHAFCTKLIKSNYVKLNIDASVRIADDSECKILKAEAVDEVLEQMFEEEDREFICFAESVKDETNFDNLKKILLQTYDVIQSLPFPYFWLKEAAESYDIGDKGIEETPLGKAFISACIKELESLCRKIANAKDFVPSEYYPNFEDDLSQIVEILGYFKAEQYDTAWMLINTLEFSRLGRKQKGTSEVWAKDSKNLRDEVKDDIKHIRDKFFFRTFDEMSDDIRYCAPQLKGLYKCVLKFDEVYSALKKEKTIVDFNDLEHLAIKVLYDFDEEEGTYTISDEAVELQKNFYEIMTDEYQDSNAVQEMMLNALAGRGRGEANRFMVGDVKQSIYRFRQADPDIFLGKINNSKRDKNSEIIYLSKNFRSRRNVLDSINYVFKRLMTEENGGLVYDDNEALYYGAEFPPNNSEEAFYDTELNIIDLSSEPLFEDENEEEFTSAQKELTFVASRIKELIEDEFPVVDKKTRQYRKIRYSDIVVLLRSAKSWSAVAEEVFEKFGIPVFTGSDGGYFDKKEIALIVSLLKVIDNSYQDIPVIAVLKSYIYGVTDNELAEIKISAVKDNFIENVYYYAENGENDCLKTKLRAFINDIENWKNISPFITVRELLWRIYTETGYYDYTGALEDGSIKQANLNLLLEKAETVAQAGVKSLFDFINYIEKIEKNAIETGEAKILNENENLVRIMTIHKSKGLEFPVVFVSGLGRKFNLSDIQENYIIHNKTGIACDCVDSTMRTSRKTIAKTVVSQKVKQEMLEEEMRVLYVALTRAKEKLILTGGIRNMDNSKFKWSMVSSYPTLPDYYVKKSNCYLDWIAASILKPSDVYSSEDIMETSGESYRDKKEFVSKGFNWQVCFIDDIHYYKIDGTVKKEKSEKTNVSADQCSDIAEKLSFEYPYKCYTDVAASMSISEIKRNYQQMMTEEQTESTAEYKKPEFSSETKGLTGAQFGTAMHAVMEHLDFRKKYTHKEVKEFVSHLADISVLTKEEAQAVNIFKIMSFLNSELYERIMKADRIKKEVPFAMEISAFEAYGREELKSCEENVLVHGIADCYFTEGDKAVLIDYKTDFVPEGEEEHFFDKYKIQLDIYAKAIERSTGFKADEKYIYSFYLEKVIRY